MFSLTVTFVIYLRQVDQGMGGLPRVAFTFFLIRFFYDVHPLGTCLSTLIKCKFEDKVKNIFNNSNFPFIQSVLNAIFVLIKNIKFN